MDFRAIISSVAPTVATAIAGPLGGAAIAALGGVLGISEPTQEKVARYLADGQLTGDQLAELRQLELKYQAEEKERGFRYAELEFKDRDSARAMAASTHSITPAVLTWVIVTLTLLAEGALLFSQVPPGADPVIVGRVLGTMDSALIMVLSFWFGTSSGSQQKTALLAAK